MAMDISQLKVMTGSQIAEAYQSDKVFLIGKQDEHDMGSFSIPLYNSKGNIHWNYTERSLGAILRNEGQNPTTWMLTSDFFGSGDRGGILVAVHEGMFIPPGELYPRTNMRFIYYERYVRQYNKSTVPDSLRL